MRRTVVASALAAAVAGAVAGCGGSPPAVHGPAFVVPTPPPMTNGNGPAGDADGANTFVTGWVHGLEGAHPGGLPAERAACGADRVCLGLVDTARALPNASASTAYGYHWSYVTAGQPAPDPDHPDSWRVDLRPYWQALDLRYPGHDGWATATMLRFRVRQAAGRWGIVSVSMVPGSPLPAPLSSPSVG